MVKVLESLGVEVLYEPEQTCCGQPAFNAGYWKESKAVCKKFIDDFSKSDLPIVTPSASCKGFIVNYMPKVFEGDSELERVERIGSNVMEFSEYLTNVLKKTDVKAIFNALATYHDSCAALRECRIKEGPRELLSKVKGLRLVEMADTETCCGFGGTFAVKFSAISAAMADQKIDHALATGADCIISTDISCLMHIEGRIKNRGEKLATYHLADVLASDKLI